MDIEMKNKIKRPNDLMPKGISHTIKGNYTFNETFQHIFNESRKPSR